jgi:hypothetical protein
LKQVVVGVVLDEAGRPICSETWPGNATDVKSLLPVVDRLRQRFGIARICVVVHHGMISEHDLAHLLVGALACAKDVVDAARLELSQGLGVEYGLR